MGKTEQLAWERRVGRLVAIAALIAPVALAASIVVYSRGVAGLDNGRNDELLRHVQGHPGPFWGSSVLLALGTVLIAPVLWFLYHAIRYRRAEIQRIALILAIAAPLVVGARAIGQQAALSSVASDYVKHPNPPALTTAQQDKLSKITDPKKYETEVNKLGPIGRADTKLTTGTMRTVGLIGEVLNLLLAGAFIIIGLNGMRSGILSRFLGILAIIIGVLYVIPIIGDPGILEFFWLIAVALLMLNRWPQGRGPAWETGEAMPWPTSQERREAMQAAREGRAPAPRPQPALATAANGADDGAAAAGTAASASETSHSRSKKRKKKRRA